MAELSAELIAKLKDPKYYLESLTKIRGKKPGSLIPFKLNETQKHFFNALRDYDHVMVLKARQLGLCLSGDTMILMADGSFKSMDSIVEGDEVIDGDGNIQKVLRVILTDPKNKKMFLFIVRVGDEDFSIKMTEDHRVLVEDADGETSWKKAQDIDRGSILVFPKGYKATAAPFVVRKFEIPKEDVVYDIELPKSPHSFVTNCGIVHNSTASVGWLFHRAVSVPGSSCGIVGYNASLASELLDKVKVFLTTIPPELRPTLKYNSKNELTFPKLNSSIQVIASDRAGRGFMFQNVLCTELPFWDRPEEKMTAIMGGLPPGGKLIIESSPGMIGDLFHRFWTDPDNDFAKLEYGWWWGYTEEEMEEKRSIMRALTGNDDQFEREFALEFGTTGRPVFDPRMVRIMRKNQLVIGDKVKLPDGTDWEVKEINGLTVYKPPNPDGRYVCGGDVAEGVRGGNYSTAHFFDKVTGEEVASYRGHITPDKFGAKLNEWGRFYNNALMAPEINNNGLTTVTILRQLIYPNLFFRPARYDSMDTAQSDRVGWKTTSLTRPLLIDDFGAACRDGSLIVHSKDLLNEMTTFVYDDFNRPVALPSFHDDCIFGAMIANQALKNMFIGKLTQLDYRPYVR